MIGRRAAELERDLDRLQIKYEGMVRAFRDIGELAKQRERDLAVLFDIYPEAEDELEKHWLQVAHQDVSNACESCCEHDDGPTMADGVTPLQW